MHDQMSGGRAFRVLTVIDQWSRESASLKANFRLTGRCVGKLLDEAAMERGWPRSITARSSHSRQSMNGPGGVALSSTTRDQANPPTMG